MGAPIRVTDTLGNVYMVDPDLLSDPTAPTDENTIQLTQDGQVYQLVSGRWYRLLRADEVTWTTGIKPNIGNRKSQTLPFALGRAVGY